MFPGREHVRRRPGPAIAGSADAEVVDTLERRPALAADNRRAVAADERTVGGAGAPRAVQLGRGRRRLRFHTIIIAAGLLLPAACSSGPERRQPIGVGYVGPTKLILREELAPRAEATATVEHGERLEILERRYRFARVRTSTGAEGWTDGHQLLSPEQMARLRHTAGVARRLPSQGKASPFDRLNVHIAPNRQSPSFYQLQEEDEVDVIGHKVTPRVPYTPDKPAVPEGEEIPGSTGRDPWTYVRLPDERAGWVLTRMIMMSIPDEVAQYAEGHHISSYFSLGTVEDRGETKHHWLWTTIANRVSHHQFDSFRVFVWNPRRHRYETAHIERSLRGYYPVEVHPMPGQQMARFSLNFSGRDGVLAKRTYEFKEYRVRQIARAPWEMPVDDTGRIDDPPVVEPEQRARPRSVGERIAQKWREWFP
jgi:hypothetical protein